MAQVRSVLMFMLAFAFLAVIAVSWLGPKYIQWDNTPGNGTAAMCLCSTQALQGAQRLIAFQMTGAAVGAGLGLIAGIAFAVMRRKSAPAA
jgi:hypothetical protein